MVFTPDAKTVLQVNDHYHYEKLYELDPARGSFFQGVKTSSSGRIRLMKANDRGHFHGQGSLLGVVWFENGYVRHMSDGDTALFAHGRGNVYPREKDPPTQGMRQARGRERLYGVEVDASTCTEPTQEILNRFLAKLDLMKKILEAECERLETERASVRAQPSQQTRHPLYALLRRIL